MIFKYPLLRNGFYYMSEQSYDDIHINGNAKEFRRIITKYGATVTRIPDYYLIKI